MKVLFVNESDFNGGAARAMYRTYEALSLGGVDVKLLVKYKTIPSPAVIECGQNRMEKLLCKVDGYRMSYMQRINDSGRASFYYKGRHGQLGNIIKSVNPDILHLHWLSNAFIDLNVFKGMQIPLVWTFHDMRVFTGGCGYTNGCLN
jgi:hypothetical protein